MAAGILQAMGKITGQRCYTVNRSSISIGDADVKCSKLSAAYKRKTASFLQRESIILRKEINYCHPVTATCFVLLPPSIGRLDVYKNR